MLYRSIARAMSVVLLAAASSNAAEPASTQPSTQPAATPSPFFSADDGAFDVSDFLASKQGFLPIAAPITEPAIGYGLTVGLLFFHEPVRAVTGPDGQPRAIMPSTTALVGGGTENGTWFGALGHLHNFYDGRMRYVGALGYASAQLDWYGTSDAFNGRSVSYTNDIGFVYQQLTVDFGTSGFYAGPVYRFMATDASFGVNESESQIPDFEFQSRTSALGILVGYDSRDHPFAPRRGIKAELSYVQAAEWLGGDFAYRDLHAYVLAYIPIGESLTLGLRGDVLHIAGDAPFYDLSSVALRGIPAGRFVDDDAGVFEAELRWDVTRRWSLLAFGGMGRTGSDFDDLFEADNELAGGFGFRYLIAEKFGLRMGVDLAYGDDQASIYVNIGTGWIRP